MNIFDKDYKRYDQWYEKNHFAYLSELEAIKKYALAKGRSLEVGVGTGRFAAPLNITMAIDSSHNMLTLAGHRGINVRWGMAEDIPFSNDLFDDVFMISTVCFVHDPSKALQECKRVLKDDGCLILGMINKNSFLGHCYMKKKSIFYPQARFFSVEEITQLLEEAGFDNLKYYQTIFDHPKKIRKIEKPQKGFDKGGFIVIKANKKTFFPHFI